MPPKNKSAVRRPTAQPQDTVEKQEAEWLEAQHEEVTFWGNCRNTLNEELKQLVYMVRMGFSPGNTWNHGPYTFDVAGQSFIDIGGGPNSVLLKMDKLGRAAVVDPLPYPEWVKLRYATAKIDLIQQKAEDLPVPITEEIYDVGLMYNCLQHTSDPEAVVRKLRAAARAVHIFEWVDVEPHPGHPHKLTVLDLQRWTGMGGHVEMLYGQSGCAGKAWYI
jgi:SAM-dependent methyltransferase